MPLLRSYYVLSVGDFEDRERGVLKEIKIRTIFWRTRQSQGCGWAQWKSLMGWLGVHGRERVLDRDED